MFKYFARTCPRRNGYVAVTMREPERDLPLQAVNGKCMRCAYRFAWIVIQGKRKKRLSRLAKTRLARRALL